MSQPIDGVTASIHVEEEAASLVEAAQTFYKSHKEAIAVVAIVAAMILVNRRLIRRELKNLTFSAEFFPYDMFDEDLMTPASVAG